MRGITGLLVDFLGSGGSDGNGTTIGFYEADQVKAAFDYLQKNKDGPIILFSTSMGPALLLYGQQDDKVSRAEIDQIFENLKGPKQLSLFKNISHDNFLVEYRDQWKKSVASFLEKILINSPLTSYCLLP